MLHVPGLGFDGLVGYSLIQMARSTIGMDQVIEDCRVSFSLTRPYLVGYSSIPVCSKTRQGQIFLGRIPSRSARNSNKIAVLGEIEDEVHFDRGISGAGSVLEDTEV